jgi:hypothetical protein
MPHPEIIRALAGEHQRDMLRAAENRRLVKEARKARKAARRQLGISGVRVMQLVNQSKEEDASDASN